MRLFVLGLFAMALSGYTGAAEPLKVLFVGNSQMMVCDLPNMIKQMADSAPVANARIEPGRALMGGATLKRHWDLGVTKTSPLGMLAAQHWDYVVIQEIFNAKAPEFEDYAGRFAEEIKKAGSTMILFATANVTEFYSSSFKYSDSFKALNDMQITFGKKNKIPVAAAGYAWMKYLGPNPSQESILDVYAKDKGHPGTKGSYIYACLLYAMITQKTPEGLTNEFKDIHGGFVIPKDEAAKMQKIAWEQHEDSVKQ